MPAAEIKTRYFSLRSPRRPPGAAASTGRLERHRAVGRALSTAAGKTQVIYLPVPEATSIPTWGPVLSPRALSAPSAFLRGESGCEPLVSLPLRENGDCDVHRGRARTLKDGKVRATRRTITRRYIHIYIYISLSLGGHPSDRFDRPRILRLRSPVPVLLPRD